MSSLSFSDKESDYLFKMVDVNRNRAVGMNRRPSFFCGPYPMVNLGGSRLSIFCENYSVKPYGSKLSVFSGHRESYGRGVVVENAQDIQEKETLLVPA